MTSGISENYRELAPEEVETFAERVKNAWQDAAIPERQWNLVVKHELAAFRRGERVRPYDVLVSCLKMLPPIAPRLLGAGRPMLLDVGAASAYYSEVLEIAGFDYIYAAIDSSKHFKQWACTHYPGLAFTVEDASNIEWADSSFDIVLHSACIMHCVEWKQAIVEATRVSRKYVIFHRTPIADNTTYFAKEAYGVECLEIHFNQDELFEHFHAAGLKLIGFAQMGTDMKSFVMAKDG